MLVVEPNLQRLSRILSYQFQNPALLKQALTHCSMGSNNYERLEFLGDAILSFTIANKLYHLFPEQSEGQLSRLRSFLVKGDMLAEIAKEISLGDFLILGQGELKSGGFRRASILADSLEAIFAAVFLDGGMASAQNAILHLYRTRLEDPQLHDCLKDAKTKLQEYLQAEKFALPEYILTQTTGSEHDQVFYITCKVPGIDYCAQGKGTNRRKAEQIAAKSLLDFLHKTS